MIRNLKVLSVLFLVLNNSVQGQTVADPEISRKSSDINYGQIPLFEETEVFVGGQDDINTYRIPSVICTKKGTVLVFCEGRRDNSQDGSPTHLVLKRSLSNTGPMMPPQHSVAENRSRQRNMTWLPIQVLIKSNNGEAYMNPVPVIDNNDGTIFLLLNKCSVWGDAENAGKGVTEVWFIKSSDEGATWTKPVNITRDVGKIALGPGIGIQLKDGRLAVPVYDGIIYSDNHGKKWKAGNKTTAPVNECQVVELTDGSLMLNTRSYPKRIITISRDEGNSWEAPYKDPTLTDSKLWGGCQASLIRYTRQDEGFDKNRLLFANPADSLYRFNMTVRVSYDEGKTWPVAKIIKKGTGSYSSLTILPDGSIGIIYETGNYSNNITEYNARLSFARFNLAWLSDGIDHFIQAH
jgi:Neuraminidase (sialidase)